MYWALKFESANKSKPPPGNSDHCVWHSEHTRSDQNSSFRVGFCAELDPVCEVWNPVKTFNTHDAISHSYIHRSFL